MEGGRFRLVGRAEFRAFKYNPHALHIVAPCGERLQSGVLVVPQLLLFINYRENTGVLAVHTCTLGHLG